MKETTEKREMSAAGKDISGRRAAERLPEDLRALSHRIRRSEKAYERMSGKRHD